MEAYARRAIELARFCVVGLLCLALSTGVLATLCGLWRMNYLLAFAAAFIAGSLLGYVLNGRFTYRARLERSGVVRYTIVNAGSLIVASMLLKVMVDVMHIWYITANLLLAVVNAPATYMLHRIVSYRGGGARTAAHPRPTCTS